MAETNIGAVAIDIPDEINSVFMPDVGRLSAILKSIELLVGVNDDAVRFFARDGAELADSLHNDLDVMREEILLAGGAEATPN